MLAIEISVCDFCPLHCKYCVSRARHSLRSNDYGEVQMNGSVLNMNRTLAWLVSQFPPSGDVVVQITGGEPTILPFGYEWSNKLSALGYKTLILSNAYKMAWEAELWSREANYLLTHHIEQQAWDIFERNVQAMVIAGHKKVVLQSIITPQMLKDEWDLDALKSRLARLGYPFYLTGASKYVFENDYYDFHSEAYWGFENAPQKRGAGEHFTLVSIRPSGSVHLCHIASPIGSIYEPLDKSKLAEFHCYDGGSGNVFCSVENTIKNCFMEGKSDG